MLLTECASNNSKKNYNFLMTGRTCIQVFPLPTFKKCTVKNQDNFQVSKSDGFSVKYRCHFLMSVNYLSLCNDSTLILPVPNKE